jgi:hypothetical protein
MQHWREKFDWLGVQLMVADVGQCSIVVDAAERMVILAPALKVTAAERVLEKVYGWWQRRNEVSEEKLCSLVTC